ncbi:hypothetical protein PsorP6_013290 [Peronosclerospora sorghi]|uniref:Uncharacterized protein n=1 Tax=Peronosclerospora sorghi TaxID=230839 RepID=A0ACC0WHH7_9STRA|nr:hypothetical protein PsorP6_013290 [Peronosclerospora sorghi]
MSVRPVEGSSRLVAREGVVEGLGTARKFTDVPRGLEDSPSHLLGHRHDWECVVVYINNPDVPNPEILGCSASSHGGFKKYSPCPSDVVDGYSVQIEYKHSWPMNHALDITGHKGGFQDLIMWEQMTDLARRALNDTNFDAASAAFNDYNFHKKIEQAWPMSWIPA